ncbi:MAG TPA: isochorismatase family protein [Kofleriaceae bacterium]|jgi:nicotinamidase-related amidase|nr:isochorismatase family protein [Kofleriaceae bacterium]
MRALALSSLVATLGCTVPPGAPAPEPMTLRARYHLPPITSLDARRTALVLVDFQQEFFTGRLRLPGGTRALDHARHLLAWARAAHVTVVHVRNLTRPGSPLFAEGGSTSAFAPALCPRSDELVVTKPTGGGFTKTELDALLRARGIDTLVVAGLMTHLAVAMTAQDASVLGYRVVVAADATATRDLPDTAGGPPVAHGELHRAALAAIADRFADVQTTAQVLVLPLAPAPTASAALDATSPRSW